ncbi:ABC transporter substrate-binding protein [Oceanobacillus picturae]|uniref:ABC transporter substrate-binding protein n=1 Tax=Oceanobacillus picturae TaxID=171693 RepID=A0A0U9HZF0_9BACI|nr:ABC transporter substrate-binding protein [Oceanobacillus picturae]
MHNNSRVILPTWIWTDSQTKAEFKDNLSKYMRRYPGYTIVEVGKYYAICHRP